MRIANARRAGRRSTARVAVVALLIVALSGCASTPDPQPTPTPSATAAAPVFASDEEALAAATEAYAAYQSVADLVLSEGGADPSRIEAVVSAELAKAEIESSRKAQQQGLKSIGKSTFDMVELQSFNAHAAGDEIVVTVYLCSDISNIDVVDATGQSVLKADRVVRTPFEVALGLNASGGLVVVSRTGWTGAKAC